MLYQESEEKNFLSTVDSKIEMYRKGNLNVKVTDSKGKLIPNCKVKVEQLSHDFLFGVNLNKFYDFNDTVKNENYIKLVKDVFNYGTISAFIWGIYEGSEKITLKNYCKFIIEKLPGFRFKGHTPIWGLDFTYPEWIKNNKDYPTENQWKDRVYNILMNFPEVEFWDLVNEPSHFTNINPVQYYNLAQAIKSNNAQLIVNDYGMFNIIQDLDSKFIEFLSQNKTLLNYEVIGLQSHVDVDEATPLNVVNDVINRFGVFNKKIHMTEFMPMNTNKPVLISSWRGKWDEDTQAKYAYDYYKTCFANPYVSAISWWDFIDTTPAWRENGGLLKEDQTPKKVYTTLKNLIKKEWWTNNTGVTNSIGVYTSKVFYGKYKVTVTYKNKDYTQDINFVKIDNSNNYSFTFKLNTSTSWFNFW